MMNNKLILILCCLITSTVLHAAPNRQSGFYLGGNIGYGQTVLIKPALATEFERNGYTWSVLAGYQINQYIGGEAGFYRMHNVFAAVSSFTATSTVEPSFLYLAVKMRAPIHCAAIFAKLGGALSYGKEKLQIGSVKTVSALDKIVPYVAVGIEYPIHSRIVVDASLSNTFNRGIVPRLTAGGVGFRMFLE